MKFQKIILMAAAFSFAVLFNSEVSAQSSSDYKSAIGARLGSPWFSGSYEFFINEKGAIEAYAGFRGNTFYNWVSASGAYQIHNSLSQVTDGLKWYYGAGASLYFWSFETGFSGDEVSTSFGLNGYLGLDYKFPNQPVSITLDWVPTFFLNGFGSGFGSGYGGVGIRYVLK